jgi:hypothetical protein
MQRFYFDLVGSKSVADKHGLLFSDPQFAAHFAESLAADLFAVRPELRGNACVVMIDEHRSSLTYCVAIAADAFEATSPTDPWSFEA